MQIEIKVKDYWVLLDIEHLFLVEIKPKLSDMYELSIMYKFPGDADLVPITISQEFTREQVNEIVTLIKDTKNPPKQMPERISRLQHLWLALFS